MFNLQGSEIIIILLLALVVLGPEKLPDAMRKLGQFYAELKKMSSGFQEEFRSAVDEPVREMRQTADLLRDSADFTKLQEGERAEKPKSAEMVEPADPDAVPTDDVPFRPEHDTEPTGDTGHDTEPTDTGHDTGQTDDIGHDTGQSGDADPVDGEGAAGAPAPAQQSSVPPAPPPPFSASPPPAPIETDVSAEPEAPGVPGARGAPDEPDGPDGAADDVDAGEAEPTDAVIGDDTEEPRG